MLFREGVTFLLVPVTLLETSVISLFRKLHLSSPGVLSSHLVILGHSLPDIEPDPRSWSCSQASPVALNLVLIPVKPSEGGFDLSLAKSRS